MLQKFCIIDNTIGTSIDVLPPFAMSGDQTIKDDIVIPAVFLYNKEGLAFMEHITHYPNALVRLSNQLSNPSYLFEDFLCHGGNKYPPNKLDRLEVCLFGIQTLQISNFNFCL